MSINIRYEKLEDQELIYSLIDECFESDDEEKLVRLLHTDNQSLVSLVAEVGGKIVGQIILSKMTTEKDSNLSIYGLAPMCVAPDYQKSDFTNVEKIFNKYYFRFNKVEFNT